MQALPLGDLGTTPWSFSPLWFAALAMMVPALVWLAFAWRQALLECPNRVRRAGVREMRRLLKTLRRSNGATTPTHLHAWLRASAQVWDVRTSAPCVSEISQAAQVLSGDEAVATRWRELWLLTEHALYAPSARPADDWLGQAAAAAGTVEMPKRERMFPNRLRDWLPNRSPSRAGAPSRTGAVAGFVATLMALPRRLFVMKAGRAASALAIATLIVAVSQPPAADADVPWSAPAESENSAPLEATSPPEFEQAAENDSLQAADEELPAEPLPPEVQQAALAALDANWNDWAAHHNLAAFELEEGNLNRAIAHATAAFAQHPDSATTRNTLLAALGDTQTVDATLRRLVFGAWYQRMPSLFSAATWQRLALIAGLLAAAGLSVMVFSMYTPRPASPRPSNRPASAANRFAQASALLASSQSNHIALSWLGRGAFAVGAAVLAVSLSSWNAYGALNQTSAAILVGSTNMSPVPTDLVPNEETSPVAAGTIVVADRTFLGWRQISKGPDASGWIRGNAVMPVYSSR